MKEEARGEQQRISDLCREFGLDATLEFSRLQDSVFAFFITGSSIQNATIETEVVRMWLASMISRDQVKPNMRDVYDHLKQLGVFELREAWEVSELPEKAFNEMIMYGKTASQAIEEKRVLH